MAEALGMIETRGFAAMVEASDAMGNPLPPMGLRRGSVMGSYAHVICEAR